MEQVNNQFQTKQDLTLDGCNKPLRIHSIFSTIQGEGPFSGHRATFIRLNGCNLKCHWCDTDYTSANLQMMIADVVKSFEEAHYKNEIVVITGGEPFAQNIVPLVLQLIELGYIVQIETSGSLSNPGFPFSNPLVHVVCSPKTPKVHQDMVNVAAWKYVLKAGQVDSVCGLPNQATQVKGKAQIPAGPMNEAPVYISPLDDESYSENVQQVVKTAMEFGHIISLQTHKILEVE